MLMRLWSHRKQILVGFAILALVSLAVPAAVTRWVVHSHFMPRIHEWQSALHDHDEKILADLEKMDAEPIFPDRSRNNNANSVLEKYVAWEGANVKDLDSPDVVSLRELFAKYPEWRKDKTQHAALAADPALAKIDTSWIKELATFDHWNFYASDHIATALEKIPQSGGIARVTILSAYPIPKFSDYRNWHYAYYFQSLKKGRGREGLAAIRHAAHLAHSTFSLVGEMTAVAILRDEIKLAGFKPVKGWKTFEDESIDRFKRLAWTWAGLVRTADWGSLNPKFERYLKAQNGFCGGVAESHGMAIWADMLGSRFPLETDFTPEIEGSRQAQMKFLKICDLNELEIVQSPIRNNTDLAFFPYIRQIVGLQLIVIASPTFMKFYEERLPASTGN
ncbi:MAG: hypothetical protein ABL958_05195 [Bdellovibrionia bacterium]